MLTKRRLVALAMAAALVLPAAAARAQQGGKNILTLRGFGLNFTGVGKRGRSGDLEIGIERWSSETERDGLQKALADGGVAALTKALPALTPRAGYVRGTGSGGGSVDLRYAREVVLADGARRVILATDRIEKPADGSNPNADTYDYLIVEVRLDKTGKGEGRTAGPQRLRYDKASSTLEIVSYASEPVWIKDLKVVAPK